MTVVEHEGTLYGLGRTVWHDPASWGFQAATAPLKTTWHKRLGPILDQGQLGACTGFATAGAMNTEPIEHAGRRLLGNADAIALYSWATHHDPYPGAYPPQDTGSSGLAAAKAAKRLGLIAGYSHAFGIDHVLGALVVGPIIVGVPWRKPMFDPAPVTGILSIDGPDEGGHELELCGVDVERELVVVPNSWGTGWGIPAPECGITTPGTCRIRFTDLDALLRAGGDATVLRPAAG